MPHAHAKTSATAGVRPQQSAFLKRQRSQPRSRKVAATNLIDFFTQRSQKAAFKPSELKQIGPLKVSPMGLGTWSWGNQFLWGYDKSMDAELQEVFNLMVSKGINIFDTADSYGEHTYRHAFCQCQHVTATCRWCQWHVHQLVLRLGRHWFVEWPK